MHINSLCMSNENINLVRMNDEINLVKCCYNTIFHRLPPQFGISRKILASWRKHKPILSKSYSNSNMLCIRACGKFFGGGEVHRGSAYKGNGCVGEFSKYCFKKSMKNLQIFENVNGKFCIFQNVIDFSSKNLANFRS